MKVIKTSPVPDANPMFIGSVKHQSYLSTEHFDMGIVSFSKGARNKWHAHKSDQVLIVTAGTGIVATEGEETVVRVGDVIHIPANEKHWHGATKDSEFTHVTVKGAGGVTTKLED